MNKKIKYKKIIFLDMDGVVNSNILIRKYCEELKQHGHTQEEIEKKYKEEFNHCKELIFLELANRITKICEETDCGIVWTSSWRNLPCYQDINKTKEMFNKRNLPGNRLISYTPRTLWNECYRKNEIRDWIIKYGRGIKKFAIIDDREDAKYNTKRCRYFQTTIENGITEEITDSIINWLNN